LTVDRDVVMQAMQAERIGVGIHYRAIHLHPYYQTSFGLKRGMFPNAEYYSDRTLSLPFFPGMSDSDVDDAVAGVKKVVASFRK
jgi:dTDP-4-amino-4,6-dideoxygalactose transaminase